MLIHSYIRKLDVKNGTLLLPPEMRQAFDGQLVLTASDEGDLSLFPEKQWALVERRIMSFSPLDPHVRRLQRLMIGHATQSEIDRKNRFLIPRLLRDYFRATQQIAILCIGNQARLIRNERWIEVQQDPQSEIATRFLNRISLPRFVHPRRAQAVEKPLATLVEEKFGELLECHRLKNYRRFELVVGELFDCHNVGIVEVTQHAKDDGFDLIVYFLGPLGWEVLFVQTKAGRTPVKVTDVRELVGAISLRGGRSGLLISIGGATIDAQQLSQSSFGTRINVDLADAYRLAKWIQDRLELNHPGDT